MSDTSESVEAFFEGSSNVYEGAKVNFSSEKIVIREIGDANKHAYSNADVAALTGHDGIIKVNSAQFTINQTVAGASLTSLDVLGLYTAGASGASAMTPTTQWVDEKAPPIRKNYKDTS